MSAHSITSRGLAGRKIPQGTLTPIGALLFSASEPGAWYDPSYMSTLFQDEAGSTPVTAVEQPVGRMLDLSGRGNHATQATTTKRPVYSRLVNLLTKTEQFDDAAWFKDAVSVVGNSGVAPDGSITADKIIPTAASVSSHRVRFSIPSGIDAGSAICGFFVKHNGYTWAKFRVGFAFCNINLVSGSVGATQNLLEPAVVQILPDGWLHVSMRPATALSGFYYIYPTISNGNELDSEVFAGDGASGILIWGAYFTLATDAHLPYQRVNTSTDYDADPAKFPAYRRLDGVDDSHASATGGGGNAGFFFSAAVTPQGGAGTARTLFSDAGTNTGYIVRLNTSNQLELAAGNGTAYTTISTAGTLAVGSTNVVQAWDDGTNLNVKIGNGATASIARPAVAAGTAGYTMGQDNGASTGYFNGRIYSTIYRKDSGLTQVQRESVALYQRQKARMP